MREFFFKKNRGIQNKTEKNTLSQKIAKKKIQIIFQNSMQKCIS